MKRIILLGIVLLLTFFAFAQDQHINGNLRVTNNLILKNDLPNSDNYENYSGRITFGEGGNANSDAIFMARYNIQRDIKLLHKIEELTLYVIDLKKENEQQQNKISSLEDELINLKNK